MATLAFRENHAIQTNRDDDQHHILLNRPAINCGWFEHIGLLFFCQGTRCNLASLMVEVSFLPTGTGAKASLVPPLPSNSVMSLKFKLGLPETSITVFLIVFITSLQCLLVLSNFLKSLFIFKLLILMTLGGPGISVLLKGNFLKFEE